jgi:hypothetical protein
MDVVFGTIIVTLPDAATITFPPLAGSPVPGPGLADAPSDGGTYGRKDGAWVRLGSAGDGGLTQDDADARYVRLSQVDAANGVAALDAGRRINEDRLPEPPIDLVVLFENQLV